AHPCAWVADSSLPLVGRCKKYKGLRAGLGGWVSFATGAAAAGGGRERESFVWRCRRAGGGSAANRPGMTVLPKCLFCWQKKIASEQKLCGHAVGANLICAPS